MAGKSSKNGPALPRARLKDQSLYLKVLQLYFAGCPSARISRLLDMKPPTVNRTLRKFRHGLVRQKKILDYLKERATDVSYYDFGMHIMLIEAAIQTRIEEGEHAAEKMQACFSNCPLCEKPSQFTFDHVDVHFEPDNPFYPASPELKPEFGMAGLLEVLGKRGSCRHCPFGSGARDLAKGFSQVPAIYLDLNYYLACQRIRDTSEYYFHFVAVILISLVRRISRQRWLKAYVRGLDDEIAVKLELRMQTRLVNRIYGLLAEPVDDHINEYGAFAYAKDARP